MKRPTQYQGIFSTCSRIFKIRSVTFVTERTTDFTVTFKIIPSAIFSIPWKFDYSDNTIGTNTQLAARPGFKLEIGLVEGLEIQGFEFGKAVVFKIEIENIFAGDIFLLYLVAGDQAHQGGVAGTPDAGDHVADEVAADTR